MRNNNSILTGDRLTLLAAFMAVADTLNFAAAAQRLHITPSTLSRRVKKLEDDLGTQLLRRTTRQVNLTEQGRLYRAQCGQIMELLQDADAQLRREETSPSGHLIVAAPSNYARSILSPLLPAFMRNNPNITVEFQCSDHYVDLIEQRIDVAVRIGDLADSSLMARKLGDNQRRLVAAPQYVQRFGLPAKPEDLNQHRCLHFSHLARGRSWSFYREQQKQTVAINPYLTSNDAAVLLEAALQGSGVAILADFLTAEALASGALVPLLPQWRLPPTGIYALYPRAEFVPTKSRAFIEFLVANLAQP